MKWPKAFLIGALCLTSTAGFPATSSAAVHHRSQWESLFNGKSLEGWKAYGTETWVVDHNTILGESSSGKYGYLMTTKDYANFMLRLKFKCETEGNSGLFFHSRITGENPKWGPDIVGMQAEIDPRRHTGGLYESGGRGWVALPTASGERAIKPVGQWNSLAVYVEGPHIVTRLNGVKIVDYAYSPERFTSGSIGLQIHTGQHGFRIRFKDLYIKVLP
ncbi:MAG: 3-keto-disaccharide hydrolase [Terriglobia bacterium]